MKTESKKAAYDLSIKDHVNTPNHTTPGVASTLSELASQLMGLEKIGSPDLIVRNETLAHERRTIITPTQLAELTQAGFKVALVKWRDRIFADEEYALAVAQRGNCDNFALITDSQLENNPACSGSTILGVKELKPAEPNGPTYKLPRGHYMHFDHSLKGQPGWMDRLGRFSDNSTNRQDSAVLLDHEYSVDAQGVRTHAFGQSAGYASCAVAMLAWAQMSLGIAAELPRCSYERHADFILEVEDIFRQAIAQSQRPTEILIIGGQSGRSALGAKSFLTDLIKQLNLQDHLKITQWGRAETTVRQGEHGLAGLGQFDVIMNCTGTENACPPFISETTLQEFDSRLRLIGDVTCDTSHDKNRIRLKSYETSDFDRPCIHLLGNTHAVTIDHSPSLFPKLATTDMAHQFFPQLMQHLYDRRYPQYLTHALETDGLTGIERSHMRFKQTMESLENQDFKFLHTVERK